MIPEGALQSIRTTVGLLVEGKYETLEKMTQGKRLSATEISAAISNYGRHLIDPPEEGFTNFETFEVENQEKREFSVDFPLWTEEEGRSDLEVRLTLTEIMDGIYNVAVDDILVP